MTVETASLIYRIDSSQAATAAANLDRMATAATGAEEAARRLSQAAQLSQRAFSAVSSTATAARHASAGIASSSNDAVRSLNSLTQAQKGAEAQSRRSAAAAKQAGDIEAANAARYRQIGQAAVQRAEALRAETAAMVQSNSARRTMAAEATAQARAYTQALSLEHQHRQAQARAAQETRQAALAVEGQRQALRGLLEDIDPVTRGLNKLDEQQRQLRQAHSQGLLDVDTFQVYNARIEESRESLARFSGGVNQAGQTAKQAAANMRMLPAQITDITVGLMTGQQPLTVFLQQGGQLKDMFGGVGPALRAMGTYLMGLVTPLSVAGAAMAALSVAAYQGRSELDEFSNHLIMTGGAVGRTANQISDMAARLDELQGITRGRAVAALTEIASSGKITGQILEDVATVALESNRLLGREIGEVVEEFARLGEKPSEAAAKLNETYNFLTASVYNQIRALEQQGRTQAAARLAQETYASVTRQRLTEVEARIGVLGKAWQGLTGLAKGAWDAMAGLGRPKTGTEQLAEMEKNLNQLMDGGYQRQLDWYNQQLARGMDVQMPRRVKQVHDLKVEMQDLQAVIASTDFNAAGEALRAQNVQAYTKAVDEVGAALEAAQPKSVQLQKALTELHRQLDTIREQSPSSELLLPQNIALMEKAIREQYKETIDQATKATQKWTQEQILAAQQMNAMASAQLSGGDAVVRLTRLQEAQSAVLQHNKLSLSEASVATDELGRAQARLDVATVIADLRRQNVAAAAYLDVLRAQTKGAEEGRVALQAYNEAQAEAALLVGRTREEVEDLLPVWREQQQLAYGIEMQAEAVRSLGQVVDSTRTKQERFNERLKELERLRGFAKTEEEIRAVERAIRDLNAEMSPWAQMTERAIEDIDRAFADMWEGLIDGSEKSFRSLSKGFDRLLAEMAHQAFTRPILITVSNALTGGRQEGGIADVWRSSSMPGGGFGSGLSDSLAQGADWLGQKIGSSALRNFSAGLSGNIGPGGVATVDLISGTVTGGGAASGTAAGKAGQWLGGNMGDILGYGSSLLSLSQGQFGTAVGGAIGTYVLPGIGTAVGSAVGSLVDGIFGDRLPTTRRTKHALTELRDGEFVRTLEDSRQTEESQEYARVFTEASVTAANNLFKQAGLNAQIDSFFSLMESSILGDRQGVASGGFLTVDGESIAIGLSLENHTRTSQGFGGLTEAEMLPRLITDIQLTILEAFQKGGLLSNLLEGIDVRSLDAAAAQDLIDTMSRMVDEILLFQRALEGLPFPNLQELSFDAAAGIVAAAGGLEALSAGVSSYFSGFYSEQEQFDYALAQMELSFQDLGLLMPTITEDVDAARASFRQLAEGIDVTTQAGAEQWIGLINLSERYLQLTQDAQELATSADDAAESLRAAADILRERERLELEALRLMGNTAEIRRRELQALDESNRGLQQYIWAVQDASQALANVQRIGQERIQALEQSFSRTDLAMDAFRSAVAEREREFNSLFDVIRRGVSSLRESTQDAFQREYERARALISSTMASGSVDNPGDLGEAIRISQQGVAGAVYESTLEQQVAYGILANELEYLQSIAEPQLDADLEALRQREEQYNKLRGIEDLSGLSLEQLAAQTDLALAAEESSRAQIAAIERQIELAELSFNQLMGIHEGIDSFPAAINALAKALDSMASAQKAVSSLSLTPEERYFANNPDVAAAFARGLLAPEHAQKRRDCTMRSTDVKRVATLT